MVLRTPYSALNAEFKKSAFIKIAFKQSVLKDFG